MESKDGRLVLDKENFLGADGIWINEKSTSNYSVFIKQGDELDWLIETLIKIQKKENND